MLTQLNDFILSIGDFLFGWLLSLPADIALIIVAVGTGAILTFARPLSTNQNLLRRCDEDKTRLKQLIREAKRSKDKEAVKRYQTTRNMIGMKTLKSEGMPLVVALLPIAVLGTWCFQRLAALPPKGDETVPISAYFPVSAAGNVVHIVPEEGVETEDGWVREIAPAKDPADGAVATWHVKAQASDEPYKLEIRYKKSNYAAELLVGQRTYLSPDTFYEDGGPMTRLSVELRPVSVFRLAEFDTWARDRLEGVVWSWLLPFVPFLGLPPWLFAYFLIAIPSVTLLKRVTGIY